MEAPIAQPLTSLQQLEDRSYFSSFHFPFNKASVPLLQAPTSKEKRPRLLVCHDMKGGYQDDKWVQGSPNSEVYSIWHWHLIDIFVYFSHFLVTLPPPSWTNAAHKHGVQVLGTFITEWDEGKTICESLLATKDSASMYAARLVELAAQLGFDGWLINIENKVEKHQMDNLLEFVRCLSDGMHESVPGSVVLWYDSVTKDGDLIWQDCLNNMNKCFFDLCDGIFTNYTWKEGYPENSALKAGDRHHDVYMGVDVFGRKTYGGGGFKSNVALKAAKNADVSAALFAPAWVFETRQGPNFPAAQNRWWGLIASCWPQARRYPLQPCFFSNFDQGFGQALYAKGKKISGSPWSNISYQQLQPLLQVVACSNGGNFETSVSQNVPAYSGGSCITFAGELKDQDCCLTLLYDADVSLQYSPLHVSYTVKQELDSSLCMLLRVQIEEGVKYIFLMGPKESNFWDEFYDHGRMTILTLLPSEAYEVQQSHGWNFRRYTLTEQGKIDGIFTVSYLKELNLEKILNIYKERAGKFSEGAQGAYKVALGQIAMYNDHDHDNLTRIALNWSQPSWELAFGKRVLSLMLTWDVEEMTDITNYRLYIKKGHDVDCELEYLGTAMIKAFYVHQLIIPNGCSQLIFFLGSTCTCGTSGSLVQAQQTFLI